MEDQKKHIDDLFRQQLDDYQEAPRGGMWDRIEGNLDKIDVTKQPGNKKTGGSRGLLGYSIALLLIAAAAFFIFKQSHKQSLQSAASSKALVVNSTATIKDEKADNTSRKELNNTANTKISISNSSANHANDELTAVKPVSANTPNSTASKESIKHTHSAGHTANRVARRQAHHSAHPNNLANNNNVVGTDQQANKDKANIEANTKTDEKAVKQPSAKHPVAEAVTKGNKALNNVNHVRKQKESAVVAAVEHATNTKASKLPDPEKAKTDKTKNIASAKIKNIDRAAVASSASLPELKKTGDKTDAGIAKKEKEEKQMKKETASTNKTAEKESNPPKNTEINNDKKLAAAEKKTQPAINNSSAILPDGKPVAANKSETKEILKQKVEESKQEDPTKNNADTNIADNNTKDNVPAAAGGGGADDIAHQSPAVFNLQAGVKLGYERGFSQYTTSKFLGAVYAQVGLSNKFAVMLQPAIKYTQLNKDINYGNAAYYNNTGVQKSYRKVDSSDSTRMYHYYGTYDSIIVKKQNTTTSYIGFEIPIMLKYKLSNSFSILGGVNIDISNLFTIGDNTNIIHLQTTTDSMLLATRDVNGFFDTLKYRHTGTPYSSYFPAASNAQTTVRLGYMLGVDYSLADKFTLEFLVTQSLSGYNNINDKNIKSLYSQPYFRLSIGYQFLNINKKKVPYNGGL